VALTTAVNDMLMQIQQRDQSLHEAQVALEARVLQRTAELDTANKELEAFSYSVSHDLRAPLRHVLGFASLLQQHVGDAMDAQGRKYLDTITEAARRMGQLIDDLLAFSRMGRNPLVKRPVRLRDLVLEVREELPSLDDGNGRHVEWRVGDLPEVNGDATMLRLAMVNLLSNALKYTLPRRNPCIEIGMSDRTAREVVVFVRDNGVGFDMQYAHKLFGVFQRLHGPDEFEGTGIGLANVKRIVHRHGGRVWADGRVNEGATFYFSLPLTEQPL
jgi:light-regulated signal transduction histidine kinase (bacteriophytochrome)